MQLAQLTSENLIMLDAVFEDRLSAINALTERLAQAGKLTDKEAFLASVLKREKEGPTALGEHLAVPHGKSSAVIEPCFACAFLKQDLQWQGIEGDEPVNMVFLLAVPPANAGSTHIEVLTKLTSSLIDDEFREALLKARDHNEVMALFDGETEPEEVIESVTKVEMTRDMSDKAYLIVLGVGIAIAVALFMLL